MRLQRPFYVVVIESLLLNLAYFRRRDPSNRLT
jgi:hypothetical protein